MTYLRSFILFVEWLNDRIGKIVSLFVFPLIFIVLFEIIARYLFGRPTIWATELSGMIYAGYFLIGGFYALRWDKHVNVEIVYSRMSPRKRALVDLFTWILFYLFCYVLFWNGAKYAWDAFLHLERSNSNWAPHIWPIKLIIPTAAFFLLLQGFTKTLRNFFFLIKGKDIIDNRD
jgi:TRAP-type mannitol/chloroaromatic compound transport system permease small subunit